MSNIDFLSKLTVLILQLPCLCGIAKAVSLTIQLVNSVPFNSVNLFYFVMCAIASKYFSIEPIPCVDGQRRTG